MYELNVFSRRNFSIHMFHVCGRITIDVTSDVHVEMPTSFGVFFELILYSLWQSQKTWVSISKRI